MKNRSRVIGMTAVILIGMALCLPGLRLRRVAAQSANLTGSYGYIGTFAYVGGSSLPAAIVGLITFDGAGNVVGSQTFVQPDPSPSATTVQTQVGPFNGTYTVNANGSGALALQFGNGSPTPVAFVITDGGSGLMFVQTGGGNNLLTGTARKQ